uniref:Uncharacterized protein n=1 Tax=Chromera velia CCMP2878 TaxID=1169474 RepID=A0A0K6S5S0_9ALVE|eukprot:Cvel_2583.t1-p1 / transcript=Cvel_2583.t1 / gene=Cvel_2583 / organism=Chromera_velia_CCMP2878 / gene_product=hypothetical protein / transcript_product=hypothetical protein / location=Cvel_scaffold102:77516-79341(+) / protein_length=208 / sequence_SO=supercontig / SO=protein_coding / is_pseudo=false
MTFGDLKALRWLASSPKIHIDECYEFMQSLDISVGFVINTFRFGSTGQPYRDVPSGSGRGDAEVRHRPTLREGGCQESSHPQREEEEGVRVSAEREPGGALPKQAGGLLMDIEGHPRLSGVFQGGGQGGGEEAGVGISRKARSGFSSFDVKRGRSTEERRRQQCWKDETALIDTSIHRSGSTAVNPMWRRSIGEWPRSCSSVPSSDTL